MNDTTTTDAALIGQIADGRAEALNEFYDRYDRLIFSVALAIVGDRAAAAEITLDVFMLVWRRAGTYRPEQAQVSTWLTAIARHRAIDILRRQGSRPESNSVGWDHIAEQAGTGTHDLEELAELSMRRERIRAMIAQLPDDQQQVLLMAYFGGYTHHQIAETLNQPLGTVKTRIRLAMQKLRAWLQNERPSLDE
jgi:RNA polymerase sigma-70 factor (ECF subfamily)